MEVDVTYTLARRTHVAWAAVAVLALGIAACGSRVAAPQDDIDMTRQIQRSQEVTGVAARTFDTRGFASVFIDDQAVPLTSSQRDALARFAPGTPPTGYLTYMTAYYQFWRSGVDAASRVAAAAVRASQRPDPSDVARAMPPRSDPLVVPSIKLVSVSLVTPAQAVVDAEINELPVKLTFVKNAGRWFIAGEVRGDP